MKKQLLIHLFVFSTAISLFSQERHGPVKIHKFVDGDTFWLKIKGSKPKKNLWSDVERPEERREELKDRDSKGQKLRNLI